MRFHNSCLYLFIYILFPLSRILVESQDTPPVAKVGEKTAVALAPISSKFPELNEGIITELQTIFTQNQQGRHHLILDIEWDFSTLSFTYSRQGDVITFTAKPNYVFRLVKQNAEVLWEALGPDDDSNKVVYLINNKVTIYKLDGSTVEIKLSLVSINIKKKRSNEFVKHESDPWDETHTFTAQDPYLINCVKKGDEVLWTASSGGYAKAVITKPNKDGNTVLELLYPKDEYGDVVVQGLTLKDSGDFTEEYTFHFSEHLSCAYVKYNGKNVWKCEKLEPKQFVQVEKKKKGIKLGLGAGIKIEIHTLGSEKPNDATKYNFRRVSDDEGHYIFHKNVKCTRVKMNNRTVWMHNRKEYGATYPKAVSYFGADEIHITFSDFLLFLDREEGIWEPFFYDYHEEDSGEGDGLDPNQAIDPNQPVDNELEDPNQQDPNHINPNESSDQQEEQEDPNQEQDPNQQATDNESTDPNQHLSSNNNNNCSSTNNCNSTARLNKNQNNSNDISSDSSSLNPVSTIETTSASDTRPARALQSIQLDIKKKESTETFDCLKADGSARYVAKHGYGFSSVKRSGSCGGSGKDFWDATDSKNYANKVYRDGTGTCSSMNNVTIFFPNNTYKHFTKLNKDWFQLRNFELFSRGSNNEEMDESQYSLHETEENLFYNLNEGSRCTEVKYIVRKPDPSKATNLVNSHITIWKHDNSKYSDKYPILLSYYCPEHFVVNFDDMLTILKRKEVEKWEETHLFDFQMFGNNSFMGTNLKILDFKKYDISEVGDEYHIKFASDANCSQLKHKGSELWKHDHTKHGDKYPFLLRYKKDGSHLFMDFGTFFVLCLKDKDKLKAHDVFIKLYTKGSDGKLVEIKHTEYTLKDDSDELQFLLNKKVVCDEIKYKGEKVWAFDEEKHKKEHPYMVSYKKDSSTFVVYFEHNFTVYEKETNNNWNPVDFDIILYSKNPSDSTKTLKLYGTNYDLSEDGDDYVFKLKQGIRCSDIKLASKFFWEHSEYKFADMYPSMIRYSRIKTKLVISFEHLFLVFLKDKDNNWKEPMEFNIKLYGYDSSDPNASAANPVELFDSDYTLEDDLTEYKFKFNQDVKCTQVNMESKELWKYDESIHKDKYPLSLRYKKDNSRVLIFFDGFYLSFYKDAPGSWIMRESITLDIPFTTLTVSATQLPPDPPKPTDTHSDSESTAAESDSGAPNPESTETPEADGNSQSQSESETITIGSDPSNQDQSNPESSNPDSTTTPSTDQDSQQEGSTATPSDPDSTDPSSPSTESQPAEEESQESQESKESQPSQQIQPAVKTITVLEDLTSESDYFTFASHKYYNTFIAKDNYLFSSIKLGDKVVYQPVDVYESAFKVLAYKDYNSEVRCIDVFLLSGSIKRFSKMDYLDEWYQRLTPLALDIKMKGSGYYFDLSSSGNIQSFLSKDNFGFRKVRYGMKKVWQSADHKGNSHKVDVKEFEDHTHLKIHLFNGDTREFSVKKADFAHFEIPKPEVQTIIPGTKPSIPQLPGGKSPSETEIQSPMNISLYKVDEPEESSSTPSPPPPPKIELVEIDIENKQTTEQVEYKRRDDKNADVFKAKQNYLISRAMKGTEEMWKAENDKNAIIIAVTVDNDKKIKCTPIFPKSDPSTPVTPPKTPGLFDLDVRIRQDTAEYLFSHDGQKKLDSFKCRPGFKVRYVKKANDILWEPRDNRNPVHVDIYYIPVTEKAEGAPEKAPEPAKPKPKHKLGVVVYYQNKCKHMCLRDDPGSDGDYNVPVMPPPKPQPDQDTAKAQQARPAPKPQLSTQQAKEPAKQPDKQPETKTGSAGSDADSSGKPARSPDPSSTESKTGTKEGPDGTSSPPTSPDQTGTQSPPSSQPASKSPDQPDDSDSASSKKAGGEDTKTPDQTKTSPLSGEDGSSTPDDKSSKTEQGKEKEDPSKEDEQFSSDDESSDDQSSEDTKRSVVVLDAKSSQPEPSTPPPTSSITPSSRSHSSPTAISSFPASHSSSSRYTSSNNSSSTTQTYSIDQSFTASSLVSGESATPDTKTSSSSPTSAVSESYSSTKIVSESSSPSTTIVTGSSLSDFNLASGQSGSTSTPVSGSSTSEVTKPLAQTTPSTQTARVSTQRVMTAAQNAAASAPVKYADADPEEEEESEKEPPKITAPPKKPEQSQAEGSAQAKPAPKPQTSGTSSRTQSTPTSGSCSRKPPSRLGTSARARSGTQSSQSRSGSQQAGQTQIGGTTTVNLITGERKSGTLGGTQAKTQGIGSSAGRPVSQTAGSGSKPAGGQPARTGTAAQGGTAGQAARTGSGTTGTGGGQSTPKPQTGSSGALKSNSNQQAKSTTPPARGSAKTGTSGSDDNDIDSVVIGAQTTTTTITHTTRTSTYTSSTIVDSSSGGTSSPGLLVPISE